MLSETMLWNHSEERWRGSEWAVYVLIRHYCAFAYLNHVLIGHLSGTYNALITDLSRTNCREKLRKIWCVCKKNGDFL